MPISGTYLFDKLDNPHAYQLGSGLLGTIITPENAGYIDHKRERTPLMIAICINVVDWRNDAVTALLATGNAHISYADSEGTTALSIAIRLGHHSIARQLIETGQSNINAICHNSTNYKGERIYRTALDIAIERNYMQLESYLRSNGAKTAAIIKATATPINAPAMIVQTNASPSPLTIANTMASLSLSSMATSNTQAIAIDADESDDPNTKHYTITI